MNIDTNTYCPLVFSGYNTQRQSFCCWTNLKPTPSTYTEMMSLDVTKEVQQDSLSGVRNPVCGSCWKHEDMGVTSMRQIFNKYKTHEEMVEEVNTKLLRNLVVDAGKVCNLACRTCSHWVSSAHVNEEKYRLERRGITRSVQHDFLPMYETLLHEDLSAVETVSVLGGEPFLNLEHLDVLQKIIEDGNPKENCHLHYVTNGTVKLPHKALNIFENFKGIAIALSIDAIGDRFSYIRTGGNWNDVLENVEYLKEIRQSNPNFSIFVHTTVSALNILYMDELLDWVHANEFGYENIPCTNKLHYSFQIFNDEQKKEIIEKLSNSKYDMTKVIGMVMAEQYSDDAIRIFWDETDITEKFRKLYIKGHLPELVDLLNTRK